MNYYSTFITVAEDCKVSAAKVPVPRGKGPTVAQIQHEMLTENPATYVQEDVLFESWFRRQGLGAVSADEIAEQRSAFFAKEQPCLRTSPLARTHGFGFHFDDEGRITLWAMESPEYQNYLGDDSIKKVAALRSKRA